MFYEVMPAKSSSQIKGGTLTYSSSLKLSIGAIVIIPLRNTEVPGIVLKQVSRPNFPTKPIKKLLYDTKLPPHLIKTATFLTDFYLISNPASLFLPQGIAKSRRKKLSPKTEQTPKLPLIPLNNAQKNALKALQEAPGSTKLLFGITGSGKTNIYLKLAENALKQQKSVIILVPEIALTSQLVRVFEDTFGKNVTLVHSRQTESDRHQIWEDILLDDNTKPALQSSPNLATLTLKYTADTTTPTPTPTPRIIIGPRSALFIPLKNLGLIIIDECHEAAYFQENPPKYSALRVASFIAKTLNISCVLGSATPLIQDFYLAKSKDSLVVLKEKAKTSATPPNIHLVDLKNREKFKTSRYFCDELLSNIEKNLANKRQSLIFHNRRGSSPLSLCENCGSELLCPHCFLPLTLHADSFSLVCHTCGHQEKVPHSCPTCGSPNILHKGFGTKLLEAELKKLFKSAKIARFDADNKKSETLDARFDEVKTGEIDILIGTQAIAKGLDLPNLATVGVVQADAGLSLPDYMAEEKTFELLTQVIGRVGRGHLDAADVFIQTFQPTSKTLSFALATDYFGFFDYLLKKRRLGVFPPFSFLASIEITLKTEALVLKKIRALAKTLSKNQILIISTPIPAFHERTQKGYTWRLLVRAKNRRALISALKDLDPIFHITLDPPSLL